MIRAHALIMKTKDRIIEAAIALYNEKGMANITSRHIAAKIQISHGNLEYHFPNKESLILAVYGQMREEISVFYTGHHQEILDPMEHFNILLGSLEEFQSKYRFFNLDVLEISRKYQKVSRMLEDTLRIRKVQVTQVFQKFIEMNYMHPEPIKGYYDRLQHTIRILITFWKPQEEILANFGLNRNGEMSSHIWYLLLPHFTAKGMSSYQEIVKNSLQSNTIAKRHV